MIIIKRISNVLFFLVMILFILFLSSKLGLIDFIFGLFHALLPIVIAFFISICLESIISRLINKGFNRKKATIIAYLSLVLILGVLIIIFISPFTKQIQIFIDTLPELMTDIEAIFKKINIEFKSENILSIFQIKIDKIVNYLTGSLSLLVGIGIAISGAFFISYDYDNIKEKVKNKLPEIIKKEVIYFFSKYLPFFSKYIYSLLIDSIITFIISFILFTIFDVNYSLIGALIITITNLIPFIGPLLAIIPLVIMGYSIAPYFAIISLSIVLLVQLVESNIIQPLIFKNVIKLHPVEGLIGVLIFSYLFGIFGMIFSPLLVVAFKLLFIEKYKSEQVTL